MTLDRSIAGLVLELTGSSVLDVRLLPQDNMKRRKPDPTRARALLSWEPVVLLREGSRTPSRTSGRSWRAAPGGRQPGSLSSPPGWPWRDAMTEWRRRGLGARAQDDRAIHAPGSCLWT